METDPSSGVSVHSPAPAAAAERPHPGPLEYVKVAIALAIVTAIEVGLFYTEALPDAALVPLLLGLSALKFALVVLWFMHLRFDSPIFARFFLAGLAIAIVVFGVVLLTFGVFLG